MQLLQLYLDSKKINRNMNTEIQRTEIYQTIDGITTLIEVIEQEVPIITQEEIIAEKEAELLRVYAEIQELKNNI
jgi:hypothetical protein